MTSRNRCNGSLATLLLSALIALAGATGTASAQLLERATVIRNARVVSPMGPVFERGQILIKGGRIRDVGETVELGFADRLTARTIDAEGGTVTPGLIDVWSGLGRVDSATSPDATATAWDAFDGYTHDALREALANGVTTIFLEPGGAPGIKGLGVVVRLAANEDGSIGRLLSDEAALCIDLGSEQSAVSRMKTFQAVRKKFRKAVEYRKALEDYEEDLKEYLEALEKRRDAKKKEDQESSKDKEKSEEPEPKDDKPAEDGPDEEPEPKPEEGDEAGNSFADPDVRPAALADSIDRPRPGRRRRTPAAGNGDESGNNESKTGKDEKKDEDDLKKPTEPKFDPTSEVLLRAFDHELPVRIEAHRSADLLNALSLAEEYNLDIVLQGATDAYLIAETDFKTADPLPGGGALHVVLGRTVRTDLYEPNEFRRHTEYNAAVLDVAGIRFAIGSGGEATASRFVAMNAQLAFARMDRTTPESSAAAGASVVPRWLTALTTDAASLLGVSNRVGRVARGRLADLVVWSGDPRDPASRVKKVMVDGEVVFDAAEP